jgi:hypothetical protein
MTRFIIAAALATFAFPGGGHSGRAALRNRDAVREHDRFGAAVWTRGQQFEHAAAVGFG